VSSKAKHVRDALRAAASLDKAASSRWFFKAGPGEYAEGDRFIGVTVPEQRKIAKAYGDLSLPQIRLLLKSTFHEYRLTALLILVNRFERADETNREACVAFYLDHLDYVNNWDLVDSSAYKLLGHWLEQRDRKVLLDLADSQDLWRQRVSMIATYWFIKSGDYVDALKLAKRLMSHEHDLIHKAVGWMLREIGNKDRAIEEQFLKKHYQKMPRTMLRYAIEKFPESKRKAYLEGRVK
jgi:3-methyladenine DNA glycosylase AlkD